MKQRTYLSIFVKQRTYLSTLPGRSPAAVAMEQIPSLILQPIVENALKHGLGPKPGPGHLWITAEAGIRCVCEWKMTASDPQSVS
jgi:hypothetical protein